jgi:hypothetical protein
MTKDEVIDELRILEHQVSQAYKAVRSLRVLAAAEAVDLKIAHQNTQRLIQEIKDE